MSDFSDFMTTGLDEALGIIGELITVDGTSCYAVASQFDNPSELTETGYQGSSDASVSISKTTFATKPTDRTIVVRAKTAVRYIITGIEENDSGWVLSLIKEV